MFDFDGGVPPWTSGLSQGTAVQLLARAYSRFKEPAYLTAAQQALGIFQTPPPQGVRVVAPAGALYAQYSFAPRDRILNGFIQSLVGLYDYTSLTKDPLGLSLFEAGDAQARVLVPRYDTGSWSLYDQFGESSLSYHELLTEFLQHLCERTRKGPPLGSAGAAHRRRHLLHDRAALHRRREHAADDLADLAHAARRNARGGDGGAVEDLARAADRQARGTRGVDRGGDRPGRTPAAVVADARGGGQLHGHAQRERPRGEHRERRGRDRRQPPLERRRGDRAGAAGCSARHL